MDKTITRGEGNFDLKLSWTKPDCENGHPAITGYYVYSKDESGAYTRVSGKLSAEATEYEIKDLDLKGKRKGSKGNRNDLGNAERWRNAYFGM